MKNINITESNKMSLKSKLDKKENIVNIISIYKTKSGDLKFFTLNQKAFISNMETNNELRD